MTRVALSDPLLYQGTDGGLLALQGASVQINVRNSTAATVYAAETGTGTVANPLTSDRAGHLAGWLDLGSYDFVITPPGGLGLSPWTQRFEAVADVGVVHVARPTTGAPTTGTWAAGDIAVDSAGNTYTCIVAGTPGTWVSGSVERGYSSDSSGTFAPTTAQGRKDYPNIVSITFSVFTNEVVYVEAFIPKATGGGVGASGSAYISDNAGVDAAANITAFGFTAQAYVTGALLGAVRVVERITTPGSYTRKLQVQSFGNSITYGSGAPAAPTYLRATRALP